MRQVFAAKISWDSDDSYTAVKCCLGVQFVVCCIGKCRTEVLLQHGGGATLTKLKEEYTQTHTIFQVLVLYWRAVLSNTLVDECTRLGGLVLGIGSV